MSAADAAAAFAYAVHLDIKFDALDLIDVPSLVEACTDQVCDVKILLANQEPSTHGT